MEGKGWVMVLAGTDDAGGTGCGFFISFVFLMYLAMIALTSALMSVKNSLSTKLARLTAIGSVIVVLQKVVSLSSSLSWARMLPTAFPYVATSCNKQGKKILVVFKDIICQFTYFKVCWSKQCSNKKYKTINHQIKKLMQDYIDENPNKSYLLRGKNYYLQLFIFICF